MLSQTLVVNVRHTCAKSSSAACCVPAWKGQEVAWAFRRVTCLRQGHQ